MDYYYRITLVNIVSIKSLTLYPEYSILLSMKSNGI